MKLDNSVRMVSLQFSFGNPDAIPRWAWVMSQEKSHERTERKNRVPSAPFIPPTPSCSIADFVSELEAAGFGLVTTSCQERIDQKDPCCRKKYWMARFGFARGGTEQPTEGYKAFVGEIRGDLLRMCTNAFWRVRAFKNPFWKNGAQLPDQYSVSINLEARQPLVDGGGQPVVARRRDEGGRRTGEPVPIQPSFRLRITGGEIDLVPATA